MSLSGNLSDLAVVDLLQFVHLSQRTGTLHLEREGELARISFHRGRMVSAWAPTSPSVCDLLIAAGALGRDALASAIERQATELPPASLGQVLVATGAVGRNALRDAIRGKIEQTIFELIRWTRGRFRFVVDEVCPDREVALAPGDIIPDADVDTQSVLMEALRLFDERGGDRSPPAAAPTLAAPTLEVGAAPAAAVDAVQLVTRDEALAAALAAALHGRAAVRRVPLFDAGLPGPGELPPVVVVDIRPGQVAADGVRRLAGRHPRSPLIAIIARGVDPALAIAAGAISALPPEPTSLAVCCMAVASARGAVPATTPDLRTDLVRLRRVLGDLRSGLLSATVSLNLMTIVADSVERAVLFVVRGGAFVALGAFGSRDDGSPLAATCHGLVLRAAADSEMVECTVDGRARVVDVDQPGLPGELRAAIDRPRSGQAVLFPVLGTQKVIALVYADNGRRLGPISDVEIVEIATSQVGLAFENELLRRQLHRVPAGNDRR